MVQESLERKMGLPEAHRGDMNNLLEKLEPYANDDLKAKKCA